MVEAVAESERRFRLIANTAPSDLDVWHRQDVQLFQSVLAGTTGRRLEQELGNGGQQEYTRKICSRA